MLTSKQRSNLRSKAAVIEPITQVGKLGINESLIDGLDKAIEKRELIKVTVLENSGMFQKLPIVKASGELCIIKKVVGFPIDFSLTRGAGSAGN